MIVIKKHRHPLGADAFLFRYTYILSDSCSSVRRKDIL